MFGRNLLRIGQKALVNSHPAAEAFRGATWAQPRIPPGVPRSLQESALKGGCTHGPSRLQMPCGPNPPSTQPLREPTSAPSGGVCHALGPNPNSGLDSQASVPRGLDLKPSGLGNPEPHRRTPPAAQEETVPLGANKSQSLRLKLTP